MFIQATPRVSKRIISLVPSITELLHSLELEEEVAGITKFCVHPESWFRSKTRIGGTKDIKPGVIDSLVPDLVIANKEENVKEQVELIARNYPVFLTDVNNLSDALEMICQIGSITGRSEKAVWLKNEIELSFTRMRKSSERLKVVYLIWKDPFMTVGSDTFINNMLSTCGLENAFSNRLRYPAVSLDEIIAADADLIFLSSEPFPFREKHLHELSLQINQGRKIEERSRTKLICVDGEMFSWYGSRLLHSAEYFTTLMNSLDIVTDTD